MDASPAIVFAEGCAAGELRYTIADDERPVWPPQVGLAWRTSAGHGTVYATTTVHRKGEEPRNLALIELDEGFRMMSRVEADDVRVGMRVAVAFDEDRTPLFRPA